MCYTQYQIMIFCERFTISKKKNHDKKNVHLRLTYESITVPLYIEYVDTKYVYIYMAYVYELTKF
jgi:hypothetical protein